MQHVTLKELTPIEYDQEIRKAVNDFEQALKLLILRGLPLGDSHFVVRSVLAPDGTVSFEKFTHINLK